MVKKDIIIASVLKPVSDVRMYHKISKSLIQHFPNLHIHLVAFRAEATPQTTKNISFYPIFSFKRLSLKRAFANYFFLLKLLSIRPKACIVSTFELLPAVLVYKCFFRCKLIYDIRENYYRNILYTKVFPKFMRKVLAYFVSAIEHLASPFISLFILAEECYEQELSFLNRKNYTILPNKISKKTLPKPKPKQAAREYYTLLYSGTISTDYGINQAIDFTKILHKHDSHIKLKIIGYCPKPGERESLRSSIRNLSYIELITDNKPLAYAKILEAYQQADFALMPYQINKSVRNRIPTKFYECLHYEVPMLVQCNPFWEDFLSKYPFQSAYFLDFKDLTFVKKHWSALQDLSFYEGLPDKSSVYWESEEAKLIDSFEKILH